METRNRLGIHPETYLYGEKMAGNEGPCASAQLLHIWGLQELEGRSLLLFKRRGVGRHHHHNGEAASVAFCCDANVNRIKSVFWKNEAPAKYKRAI